MLFSELGKVGFGHRFGVGVPERYIAIYHVYLKIKFRFFSKLCRKVIYQFNYLRYLRPCSNAPEGLWFNSWLIHLSELDFYLVLSARHLAR